MKAQVVIGTAAYRQRKYEEAWTALNAAWLLKESGAVSAMLAEVEMRLGRFDAAATHWAYAKEHLPSGSRDAYKQAKDGLEECQKFVGTLEISIEPLRTDVIIDRKLVQARDTAMHAWVMPGSHTVLGALDGERFSTPETVVIGAGETKHIHIEVPIDRHEPSPKPPPAPLAPTLPVVPSHEEPEEPVSEPGAARTFAVVTGAGLTAVALGLGAWFSFHRGTIEDDIVHFQAEADRAKEKTGTKWVCAPGVANPPAACTALSGAIDDYNRETRLANITLALSAGLGAATIATYLLWPSSAKEHTAMARPITLVPWSSRDSKGVHLLMRF